jgi:SAM-dependent methyltransferase
VDPAQLLLDTATDLDRDAGVQVRYNLGKAEDTHQSAQSFDIVTAGQCWHWFEQSAALTEIRRVLRPRGRLIVAYFDWFSDAGHVDEMYKLQKKYNPAWKSGGWPLGFYPQKPGDLSFEGWHPVKSFSYVEDIPYTHEAWRGRMRAYAGIGGSLAPAVVEAFDAEIAVVLAEKFPQEPMMIPHKVWAEMWEAGA